MNCAEILGWEDLVKYYCFKTFLLVLRVGREYELDIRLALVCINVIKSKYCVIRNLEICGSARTCKEKLLKIHEKYNLSKNKSKESELYIIEFQRYTQIINQLEL